MTSKGKKVMIGYGLLCFCLGVVFGFVLGFWCPSRAIYITPKEVKIEGTAIGTGPLKKLGGGTSNVATGDKAEIKGSGK